MDLEICDATQVCEYKKRHENAMIHGWKQRRSNGSARRTIIFIMASKASILSSYPIYVGMGVCGILCKKLGNNSWLTSG